MTIAWVIGSGGLLGSALNRALSCDGTELFIQTERFHWGSPQTLGRQMAEAVRGFAASVGAATRWEIYWAAGVGTMSSSKDQLAPETQAFSLLLSRVESEPKLTANPGAVAFASSAGAVYAGSSDYIVTENTSPAPTTAYAREKLKQEELLRACVDRNDEMAALLARISTLYGPGQSHGKRQGLLAHIARCMLRNQPVQIYVPFDTIRDYILAADAAVATISALRATGEKRRVLTKIIASESPTTIAEIISNFKRIARRPPRIVTSASTMTGVYSRRIQFRSLVAPQCKRPSSANLLVGIAQLMAAERAAYAQGPEGGDV